MSSRSASDLAKSTGMSSSRAVANQKLSSLAKLRDILLSSKKNVSQIFNEIDADGSGAISAMEFRHAVRKLGLGLTSKEIDAVLLALDTNGDQKIDYTEFMTYMQHNETVGDLKSRVQGKLARLKELMILHMTSINDAFRYFDTDGEGNLAFSEFNRLVARVHELANEKTPAYSVIKDLFETIDIRSDGVLDMDEWQQTFGRVYGAVASAPKLSMQPSSTVMWENSRDVAKIGFLLAKNRKQILECFERECGKREHTLFSFQEGKRALDDWLYKVLNGKDKKPPLSDEQLRCVFRVS